MDWLNSFAKVPSVEIDGRDVPLAIRRHATAKRLTMRLAPDGSEIRITMPRWSQTRDAVDFAESRRGWLAAQLAAHSAPVVIANGARVPVRGEDVTIDWDAARPRKPHFEPPRLYLGGPADNLSARIERWLRAQALPIMADDLEQYCALASVPAPDLALSRAQRRWGSCSSSGTVRINWRLIMAPDPVRRSVVAHEVAHLVHFDHSPAFHRLLGDLFEGDIDDANRWLKAHGRALYSYFG